MSDLISVRQAEVRFPVRGSLFRSRAHVHAVDRVDLSLRENETVALVGESGSGKTTLGLAILRLRPLSGGTIHWRGTPLAELKGARLTVFRRDVQIVFQDPYASLNPRQPVSEALRRPLTLHGVVARGALQAEVLRLLDLVGLSPSALYADRYPHEFSGGQRQRIGIARALAVGPRFIVADEPVSALDLSIQAQVLNLMSDLQEQMGLAYLFISHDLRVVAALASRLIVMRNGKIVEEGPAADLFARPQSEYTRALFAAAFDLEAVPLGVVNQ